MSLPIFIEKIQDWLVQEERSQAYLARKANISQEQISRIINRKHKTNRNTENKILSVIK